MLIHDLFHMTDVTKKPFLGFWEVDLAKQLTFDFPELAVLLGYQITECAGGWSFLKLVIDPTQLFRLKRSFLTAGTSPFKQNLDLKHKNGSLIYLAVIGRARMSQAGHIRIEGTIEDITDYKSEKEVLWLANRQLASFIQQLPVAIAIIDDNQKYIAASNVWKVHFNLEHTEVAGESHYNMFPGTPKIWKQYHRRAMEGEHIKMEEDSFLDRYGNTDWIQWEIKPWYKIWTAIRPLRLLGNWLGTSIVVYQFLA
ncbi:PAS domain S-box-containing protein [Dyadobacter psychrophilus]|uniref:PAS domain S-box-containing protein n=2 Tax=Dyadobacter psychrophilus TaxID=651661 RepID=A0A1T5C0D8_9BACT|nr:PAS domain S-box-containing protein [Dyadobacter psychrophilus]